MKKQFDRVLIVAHDNYGSREMFCKILNKFPNKEYKLYITQGLFYKKTYLGSILKLIKEASFIFCAQRFFDLLIYYIQGDTLVKRAKHLSKKYNLDIRYTNDINSEVVLKSLQEFSPDIMISLYTMHIYKKDILNIPKICLGTHPSLLPEYRGLESYFWALSNSETELVISVFYVNEKVDGGNVVAFTKFPIDKDQTVDGLYIQLTAYSANLYASVLEEIFRTGEKPNMVNTGKEKTPYCPMPTREAQRKFANTGRKYRNGYLESIAHAIKNRLRSSYP